MPRKRQRKHQFDGLKKASKILPVGSRIYFIRAFKMTQEPDTYDGDFKMYMKDICEHLKMRKEDCIYRGERIDKAIELLEKH